MKLQNYTIKDIQGVDYTIEFTFDDRSQSTQTIDFGIISDQPEFTQDTNRNIIPLVDENGKQVIRSVTDVLHAAVLNYIQSYIQGKELEKASKIIVHPSISSLIGTSKEVV